MNMQPTVVPTRLNRRALRRGLTLFLMLAVGGLVLNFARGENQNLFILARNMRWEFALALLACIGIDWLLSGYRLYVFGKPVAPHTSLADYIRAALANFFAAGLTPSSTGGGPAQIYIMQRAGVPITVCLALSVINLFSTLLLFFIGGTAVLFFDPGIYPGSLNALVHYGFLAFCVALVLLSIITIRPEWSLKLFGNFNGLVRLVSGRLASVIDRQLTHLDNLVHEYKDLLVYFVLKRPMLLCKSLLGTTALYFNKFLIAYFIVRMLGLSTPFLHLAFVQMVQLFLVYFAPTPGASGVAEISASSLMAALIPAQETAYFALLWRMSTLYLALTVGGWVLMRQLGKDLGTAQPVFEEGVDF